VRAGGAGLDAHCEAWSAHPRQTHFCTIAARGRWRLCPDRPCPRVPSLDPARSWLIGHVVQADRIAGGRRGYNTRNAKTQRRKNGETHEERTERRRKKDLRRCGPEGLRGMKRNCTFAARRDMGSGDRVRGVGDSCDQESFKCCFATGREECSMAGDCTRQADPRRGPRPQPKRHSDPGAPGQAPRRSDGENAGTQKSGNAKTSERWTKVGCYSARGSVPGLRATVSLSRRRAAEAWPGTWGTRASTCLRHRRPVVTARRA